MDLRYGGLAKNKQAALEVRSGFNFRPDHMRQISNSRS